ncbi:MAG: hypothetical protein KKE17_01960 [Proteobacteria bacterium]|nr:hypothetical protein [Pseudomonadota bacterium]MBU1708746.1 hypothetical protein [Pseudomonadota bacterium]
MAEIRSTLDMVMERAARMTAESGEALDPEEQQKQGMRKAAGFMRGDDDDLLQSFTGVKPDEQVAIRQGMAKTLLRNIVLPRDEESGEVNRAIQGLLQLGQGGSDLMSVFSDMKSILDRYGEHKKQLREQLENAFAQQMQQMEQSVAKKTGVKVNIDPSRHPKFQEEWLKYKSELDDQYGRALDQHKELVSQRLSY